MFNDILTIYSLIGSLSFEMKHSERSFMHFICYEWSEEIFVHMESNFLFQGSSIFYFKEFISYINIYQKINKPIYIKKINKIRNLVGSFEQWTPPINAVLPLSRELGFGGKWATCSYFIYIISIFFYETFLLFGVVKHLNFFFFFEVWCLL